MKRYILGFGSFLVIWCIFSKIVLSNISFFMVFPALIIGFLICLVLARKIVDYFLGNKDETKDLKKSIKLFQETEAGMQDHQSRINK